MFILAKNITKKYGGVTALNDVTFDVIKGEVHGLVGVNGCGKSTLMKIIAGAEHQTSGDIYIDDIKRPPYDPAQAMQYGIGIIYQDLSLFPNMSVYENIYLSKVLASKKTTISPKSYEPGIRSLIEHLGIELDLHAELGELPIAKQQLVAIIRALFNKSRLIILDEPTTALTGSEISHLFQIVSTLRSQGLSFVFISHKLNEITEICDRITVFKDGKLVDTFDNKSGFATHIIEKAMLGHEITYQKYPSTARDDTLLEVQNLSKENNFKDISFTLKKGEVLGIAGQLGAGRTELALALFGAEPAQSGAIKMEGREITCSSIQKAVDNGIAYVPEDRLHYGLVLDQSIRRNATICSLRALANNFGFLNIRRYKELATNLLKELYVKYGGPSLKISSLSGGNQQKVVLAKWLAINPRLLILDSPTVGIDVGAKNSIYEVVHKKTSEGVGVIFISDELAELLANCDRIAVMAHGRFRQIYDASKLTEESLFGIIQEK